jgi:DNA-binding response OmpR family regulator
MTTILVVDDDPIVTNMIEKVLVRAGYKVIRADNGKEALRLYDPKTVGLVLTDLVMPDMEGIELMAEFRRLYSGIKTIAMSGGGRNVPEKYLSLARHLGANCTLSKPFSNAELLAAVQDVLGLQTK